MNKDQLQDAIRRLQEYHGPLSLKTTIQKLDEEGFWSPDWVARVLYAGKAAAVSRVYRAEQVDGSPDFLLREADEAEDEEAEDEGAKYVQLSLAEEDDWKYTIQVKAHSIEHDVEKFMRLCDIFEARFGYRFQPEIGRLAHLNYDDTSDTTDL